MAATGDSEETVDVDGEEVEECRSSDSAVALLLEDDPGPGVYAGMDTDAENMPLLPIPHAVSPPPIGSCERRHRRFHSVKGVHMHRLSHHGQQAATLLAGALQRFELQLPGRVAREVALADMPMLGDEVCSPHLGDTAVLDRHPGDVRGAEPIERLPLAVHLAARRRLLEEAGLVGAAEEGLYVALWRSSAGLAPQPRQAALHASAAPHPCRFGGTAPEGMEVVLSPGADGQQRWSLPVGNAVLAPTSITYHLENRGGDPRLLVVVGTRLDASTGEREPEQHGVAVEGETAGGTSGGPA